MIAFLAPEMIYSHVPARRIGQRWRATRAPTQGTVAQGRADGPALTMAKAATVHKAINALPASQRGWHLRLERAGWRGLSPTWPAQPLTRGTACRDRALGRGLCSIGRADRCESGLAAGVEEAWKAQVGAAGWHRTDLEGTVSFASNGRLLIVAD